MRCFKKICLLAVFSLFPKELLPEPSFLASVTPWFLMAVPDIIFMTSQKARFALFGSQNVPVQTESYIHNLAAQHAIDSSAIIIKQANPFWQRDPIFSVHNSLFISPSLENNPSAQWYTTRELVRIDNHRDLKIIVATLCLPFIIHYGLKGYGYAVGCIEKNPVVLSSPTLQKLLRWQKEIASSALSRYLLTALALAGVIIKQDMLADTQTAKLLGDAIRPQEQLSLTNFWRWLLPK